MPTLAKYKEALKIGAQEIDTSRSHNASEYNQTGWYYNHETQTLILDNYTYSGNHPGIQYVNFHLKIMLIGTNSIVNNSTAVKNAAAIYGNSSLTITSYGRAKNNSLILKGHNGIYIDAYDKGFFSNKATLTITDNANLDILSYGMYGIFVDPVYNEYEGEEALIIDNATVTSAATGTSKANVEGRAFGIFTNGRNIVIQNNAVVSAIADEGCGIGVNNGYLDIEQNINSVTFSGKEFAMDAGVITMLPGTGWSDMTGTKGAGYIPAENGVRWYMEYKKIVFGKDIPATFTISFNANGGAGSMGPVTVIKNSTYMLPACTLVAPLGKTFDKWDAGPVGTLITVNGNLTLKAIWKDLPSSVYNRNVAPTVANEQSAIKPVGTEITGSGGATYVVTSSDPANPTVSLKKVTNKKTKSVTVPATISADGVDYAVTGISSKAFSGLKKLKKITIKSTKLNASNVQGKAFKGVGKNVTVKVPKSMKKTYKKLFVKKGLSKKVKIK